MRLLPVAERTKSKHLSVLTTPLASYVAWEVAQTMEGLRVNPCCQLIEPELHFGDQGETLTTKSNGEDDERKRKESSELVSAWRKDKGRKHFSVSRLQFRSGTWRSHRARCSSALWCIGNMGSYISFWLNTTYTRTQSVKGELIITYF